MASSYVVKQIGKAEWLALVSSCQKYNYRQSWDFGVACAARLNAVSEHVLIQNLNGEVLGLADVRVKQLPLIGGGIAYCSGGPLFLRSEDEYNDVVSALLNEYVHSRSLTLRVMPPPLPEGQMETVATTLLDLGFNDKSERKQTILIDLSQSLDEIRKKFHQKWRNCLNKGEKGSVTFRSGTGNAIFKEFRPLFEELITEKKFSVELDIDFYTGVQKELELKDKFLVTLAELDGRAIAGHVSSLLGDTGVYLLGATSHEGRKLNAAYLLQWQAIKNSKAAGCLWYDLGGTDPVGNPGVYRFKNRMGGHEITMPGPFEFKAQGVRANLTSVGEMGYKLLKSYRNKFSS